MTKACPGRLKSIYRQLLLGAMAFAVSCAAFAQDDGLHFAPRGLLFRPLAANTLEPRMGVQSHLNDGRLRLDIGNSADVLAWTLAGNMMTAGTDFFTWTSLRREKNFHFPVEAVDYLFGVNVNYAAPLSPDDLLSTRLRISHISAHLVDGSYEKPEMEWREQLLPRVYSREFFDLVVSVERRHSVRLYAGMQYIYHVDPVTLGKWAFQCGTEFAFPSDSQEWCTPYVAYDFKLANIYAFAPSHTLQAGLILGHRDATGVNIFFSWFSGNNQHGEYFDRRWEYWGPGFSVNF